ncbi:MAG TPA: Ig-like domain-containing protein [Gemmatimonadales bacterium]|nr:Ig-like domain-containing protein [Gemmatimonadales bacterium]
MALGDRFAALVFCAALAACSNPVQPERGGAKTGAAGIRVSVVLARVGVGQSFQLFVTARDSNGAVIPNPTVTYASSNTGLATVSSGGLIHGVSLGPTDVRVTAGGATAVVPVVVATSPAGTLTGTLSGADSVASRPFTVTISSKNDVYVGRQDLPYVQRTQLPDTTFGDSVLVGADPTDITFDFAGTTAYITDQFSSSLGVAPVTAMSLEDSIPLPGQPYRVVLDLEGNTAFVTTNNQLVVAVNLLTRDTSRTWSLDNPSNGLAWSPDGVHIYASTYGGYLHSLNTSTGTDSTILLSGKLQDVVVANDGRTVYVANETGAMWVLDSTGAHQAPGVQNTFSLVLSPDGNSLYASQPALGTVLIVDRASLTVSKTLDVGGMPRRIAFDPLGTVALIGNEGGYVSIVR